MSQRNLLRLALLALMGSTIVTASLPTLSWATEENERKTEISGVAGVDDSGAVGGVKFSTQRVSGSSLTVQAVAGPSPTGGVASFRGNLDADLLRLNLATHHWVNQEKPDKDIYAQFNLTMFTFDAQADLKDFRANVPTSSSSPKSSFGPTHFQMGLGDLSGTLGGSAPIGKNSHVQGHVTLGVRPEVGGAMDGDSTGAADFVVAPHGGGNLEFDINNRHLIDVGGNVIYRHDFLAKMLPTDANSLARYLGRTEPDMYSGQASVSYSYVYKPGVTKHDSKGRPYQTTGQALTVSAVARYDHMDAKSSPMAALPDTDKGASHFFGATVGGTFDAK